MLNDDENSAFVFPCRFPIKIMGPADLAFEARILTILRKHAPDLGEGSIKIRHSKEGTYISITAFINASNKKQLDDIYLELSADSEVLMLL